MLADGAAIGVVLQYRGDARALAEEAKKRHVVPAGEIWWVRHDPFGDVDGAWR
jgi:hypothetical protein